MVHQQSVRSARQERLDGILHNLMEDKEASPQSLAAAFEVSVMTIHRDLDELQRRGMVRKFHGGVVVERTGSYEIAASLRSRIAVPQKEALASAAAQSVLPGQVIMLDDSTTAAAMIPHLGGIESLRVVTNYLPGVIGLTAHGEVAVQMLGGDYDHGHESFLGIGAIQAVRAVRADVLFFSTSSADGAGIYHQEEKIVALKTEMLRSARRRVLLMDSSKFADTSLHLMSSWQEIDELITDDGVSEATLGELKSLGVAVRVVQVPPGQAA